MAKKLRMHKALSMCLVVVLIATYSMVALANAERVAGEILISGNNINGQSPLVKVNGEAVQSGRSIFSSSTVVTPNDANAIINLGKVGKIELAPNTTLALAFSENGISGDLLSGQVTVLNAADTVNITTVDGNLAKLNPGDSATATSGKAQTTGNTGGSNGLLWGIILGGAVVAIIIASRTDNNRIRIGGGTIISPSR